MITDALRLPVLPDASTRPRCLPGTRIALIKFILEWATHDSDNERILWLSGLAGSGKSTISATVADLLEDVHRLGSLIFFSRDVEGLRRPELMIRRWADKLASFDPRIAEALDVALKEAPGIIDKPLHSQFAKLIVEPLSIVSLRTEGPIVMVVDALDECGSIDERSALLSVFGLQSKQLPPFIKILITSRDESDIRDAFCSKDHILEKQLNIDDSETTADVSKFFHHQFLDISKGVYGKKLPVPWPRPDIVMELEHRAGGLFIWAATVCKFVKGHGGLIDHQAQLELILNKTSPDPESPIDKLYSAVLDLSCNPQNYGLHHDFKLILATIATAQSPLSLTAITQFLVYMPCMSNLGAMDLVQPLGSLLSGTRDPNTPLRPLHPSFYDFLRDAKRSKHLHMDQKVHSTMMATACLEIIIHGLTKDDICGVGDPFYLNKDISDSAIKKAIPESLQYACCFLVDHIVNVTSDTDDLIKMIKTFLYEHLLYWIEALSLMKMLDVAFHSLIHLEQWLNVSSFSIHRISIVNIHVRNLHQKELI